MIERLRRLLRPVLQDQRGALAIEFALIGPILLVMMLGVIQGGMALQNYNAVRNVSADVARYTMVQYETGNRINNTQIRTYALSSAQGAPYLLRNMQLNAQVTNASPQRVAGAVEKRLTITYQVDSLLDFAGIEGPYLSFTRPIFLVLPS